MANRRPIIAQGEYDTAGRGGMAEMGGKRVEELIGQADRCLQSGRLPEAQALCEQALAQQTDSEQAHCLLGITLLRQNMFTRAEEHFFVASMLNPGAVDAHSGLGLAAAAQKRPEEAAVHFQRAIELEPDNLHLHQLRCDALLAAGRRAEAEQAYQRIAELTRPAPRGRKGARGTSPSYQPDSWQMLLQQALVLLEMRKYADAERLLQQALALQPDQPIILYKLAQVIAVQGRNAEAEQCYRRIIVLQPNAPQTYQNLGALLSLQGRSEEAIASYRQALHRDPDYLLARVQLAAELRQIGLLEESETELHRVLQADPDNKSALIQLAHVLDKEDGKEQLDPLIARILAFKADAGSPSLSVDTATSWIAFAAFLRRHGYTRDADEISDRICATAPENVNLHRLGGLVFLKHGDFARGWREYARRTQDVYNYAQLPQPAWDGGPLEGRMILVHAEQGLGDTIQFVRFLPQVKAAGGRVILRHQPALATLLEGVEGWDELTPWYLDRPLPDIVCEVQCPLMSLPAMLKTEDRIPAQVPYIRPDPDRVQRWRDRLADHPGYRVGLVWAGNPGYAADAYRSCRLSDFAPLAGAAGVRLFSLQKGVAVEQAATPPAGMSLVDLGPELYDFADTAAAIMNLDLVVSVDTSVAHLAGALGRPVWTLLPYHCDWRWMEDREDTPWYPTMRLFRQPRQGDWEAVMMRICRQLQGLLATPILPPK